MAKWMTTQEAAMYYNTTRNSIGQRIWQYKTKYNRKNVTKLIGKTLYVDVHKIVSDYWSTEKQRQKVIQLHDEAWHKFNSDKLLVDALMPYMKVSRKAVIERLRSRVFSTKVVADEMEAAFNEILKV